MQTQIVQFSIVVTGEAHNPTILNPDFLILQGIVPNDWSRQVKVSQAITTPPFAIVAYSNGISILVEHEKLQVIDAGVRLNPAESPAVVIAEKYVRALPHVNFKAVGVNIHSVTPMESARDFLKRRFVRSGAWDTESEPLFAAGVRLAYPIPTEGRVVFDLDTLDPTGGEGQGKPDSQLIVKANFHRDCRKQPAADEVVAHLSHVGSDWDRYQRILRLILELES